MTRYILCGGNDRAYPDFGARLLKEINQYKSHPIVLSCMFAVSDSYIDEKFASWKEWWSRQDAGFSEYICASREMFREQVGRADVIILHGGNNDLLIEALDDYPELAESFSNKLVIGSSAGAYWLSKAFFSRSFGGWRKGTGIVPYSVMAHYGVSEQDNPIDDWSSQEAKIYQFNGDAPERIIRIKEGEFFIYEDN